MDINNINNTAGRLAEIDDPAQKMIFSYDKLSRLKTERRTIYYPNDPVWEEH